MGFHIQSHQVFTNHLVGRVSLKDPLWMPSPEMLLSQRWKKGFPTILLLYRTAEVYSIFLSLEKWCNRGPVLEPFPTCISYIVFLTTERGCGSFQQICSTWVASEESTSLQAHWHPWIWFFRPWRDVSDSSKLWIHKAGQPPNPATSAWSSRTDAAWSFSDRPSMVRQPPDGSLQEATCSHPAIAAGKKHLPIGLSGDDAKYTLAWSKLIVMMLNFILQDIDKYWSQRWRQQPVRGHVLPGLEV